MKIKKPLPITAYNGPPSVVHIATIKEVVAWIIKKETELLSNDINCREKFSNVNLLKELHRFIIGEQP